MPDETDMKGNTLLHVAALQEDINLLLYLLKENFLPTVKNSNGQTAEAILVMHVENSVLGEDVLINQRLGRLDRYRQTVAAMTS